MPQHTDVSIQDLHLDLANYRTLPQADEAHALHADDDGEPRVVLGVDGESS